MMRVAIVGSRNCKGYPLDEIMRRIPSGTTEIISGGAAGIDHLAELAAREQGISFRKILPDYQTLGRQAPLVRNEEIVASADFVLAFWDLSSTGTASVIANCIKIQKPFEIVRLPQKE